MFWDLLAKFVTTVGNISAGNAQAKASAFNARISEHNAGATEATGRIQEDRIRREGRRRAGQIRANVGASGFELEGSASDLLAESTFEAEFEALSSRYTFGARAESQRLQGGLQRQQSTDARRSGFVKAASSLLVNNPFSDEASGLPFKLGGA